MQISRIKELRLRLSSELLALQRAGGYWEGQLNSDIQSTAAATIALHFGGEGLAVEKGLGFLKKCQNADGGWGFSPGIESDIDSSVAALSALSVCAGDGGSHGCERKCFDYCDRHHFKTGQFLSKFFLYFSGIEGDISVPAIEMNKLPHPERMILGLALGLKSQNRESLLSDSRLINGLRSWRGLVPVTGMAYSSQSKIGISDDAARQWLKRSQNADGGFPHTNSLAVWDTVIASIALMDAGINPGSSKWLLSVQDASGGWHWDADGMGYIDLDDIGFALLVLLMSDIPLSDRRIQSTLGFIKAHQNTDGGFPTFEKEGRTCNRLYWNASVPDVTAHVLRALKIADMGPEADGAEKWLVKSNDGGLWKGVWFKDDLFSTLSVLEAIDTESVNLDKTRKRVLTLQNEDGGFGLSKSNIEETAWGVSALLASGCDDREAIDDSIRWLCDKAKDTLASAYVGTLPMFNKRYSDSLFPIVYMLDVFNKYLKYV